MAVKMMRDRSSFLYRDKAGKEHFRAEIVADTVEELPAVDGLDGVLLAQGSVADVINEGTKYQLNSSGEWKESSFSDAIRIKGRVDSVSELPEDAKTGWLYFVGAATDPECAEYLYTEEGTWEHIGEGVAIEIDSALSTTSENPVQNKVITDALGGKVGTTDYATSAAAGIVKPDGVTTTVDADGTIHAANVDVSSWYGVRDIVNRGLANRVFRVGDQLTCTRGADTLVWDIVDIDSNGEGITLLMHEAMPELQFNAKEAVFAFPDGLAAGEYHFTVSEQPWYAGDVGKTISFTLAQAIPEGGQLVLNNSYNATMIGATISSYASPATTTATETVTMSEGSGGTDLGSLTNAGTPANHINSIQRALLGSNRWKDSAIRQMMNSDKAAGSVWTPQTEYDRPPSWASNTAGFLSGLEPEFLSVVSETAYVVAKNTVTDGGGTETLTDKFYLPSRTEIFGDNEIANNPEGAQYAYYVGATNADRIKYRAGTARSWWLRTPRAPDASTERCVTTSGAITNDYATTALGWVPACRISKS